MLSFLLRVFQVSYYGSYMLNDELWIIMELCSAGSVADLMAFCRVCDRFSFARVPLLSLVPRREGCPSFPYPNALAPPAIFPPTLTHRTLHRD